MMDDTFGGEQTQSHAHDTTKSDSKGEGIVPVCIKQLISTDDSEFQMWGMKFGMISCVAIVRGFESASTRITYQLEDHTGQIEAHYWIEEGDTLKSPNVMINSYCHVYGTMRKYGGKKTIMVFKMTPVVSVNEVTTHLLEVLNARYKAESYAEAGNQMQQHATTDVHMFNPQQSGSELGLEGKFLLVYQAVKHLSKDGDASIEDLKKKFTHMSEMDLQQTVDFLCGEGHIYATLDSTHFRATDS